MPTETVATYANAEPAVPATADEVQFYHNGFIAGLTAYAREKGDSCLKSDNALLKRLMDEQGWKTIESFEQVTNQAI